MNILFDLDGTLIDSSASILASVELAFKECGLEPQAHLAEELIGPPLMEMLQIAAGTEAQEVLQQLAKAFRDCYDSEGYKKTFVFDGIDEVLSALKADEHRLFIVTNKRLIPTQKIITYLGWADYFEGVYALDSCPYATDKAQVITYVLDKHQLNFKDSLYIGDTVPDRIAALKNAIPFLMVSWGYEFSVSGSDDYVTSATSILQYVRDSIINQFRGGLNADVSFFSSKSQPYYICVGNYNQKFAGVRALYYLCHALNELGMESYILGASSDHPTLRAPRLTLSDVKRHERTERVPIAVYPETTTGNPFQLPNVVRWLLNTPGLLGGPESFDAEDIIYAYTTDYIPKGEAYPLLIIPVVDHAIFNNDDNSYDNKRSGTAYYANKYIISGGKLTDHVKDSISLCQDQPLSPQQIADVLRRVEALYCYEPSAIIREATSCGCPVIIIRSDYTDTNLAYPITGEGIASTDSPEDIAYAKATLGRCQIHNQLFQQTCMQYLKAFVRYTQTTFSERNDIKEPHKLFWSGDVIQFLQENASDKHDSQSQIPGWHKNKKWLKRNVLTEGRAVSMAENMMVKWQKKPTFHLVTVVNATELGSLALTLESLQTQLYQAWGLTILSNIAAPDIFSDIPENVEWIQVHSTLNEEIEKAVQTAQLDWLLQLIPGDKLTPHALLSFAETINMASDKHFIYSDEVVDESKADIWFKPEFNLDYLMAFSYLGRSFIVSREAFERIGGYTGLAYVYTTDLAFKVYENYGEKAFAHIPDVLYTAALVEQLPEQLTENEWLTRHAHLSRSGLAATISHPKDKNRFKTTYTSKNQPKVSIVIAHHNHVSHLARCLEEIERNTTYINYEVVVVDVLSDIEDLADVYAEMAAIWGDRFIQTKCEQANYSAAINYGVSQANGELIVVLSCFAMTVNGNWLNEMMPLMKRDDVGLVGARVLGKENKIIHAGGVFGKTDDVTGLCEYLDITESGYMERAHCIQQLSSVSSACFMINKEMFEKVTGLSEEDYADTRYAVMDLCHKVQAQQKSVLWSPYVTVFQDKSLAVKTNGVNEYNDLNEAKFIDNWTASFSHDPFYNDNLSLQTPYFSPEVKIQQQWDSRFKDKLRIVAFPLNGSGTGQYRMIAPLQAMADAGEVELTWMPFHDLVETPFLPSLFELARLQPDILYVQQMLSDVTFEFLQNVKEQTDIKIVFSLDDLVSDLPKMSNRKDIIQRDMKSRLRKTLALCHHTIVSTQPLADLCQRYTDNVSVIPNRLESERWLPRIPSEKLVHNKPRVGWAGAQQHGGDLALMTDVVKTLSDKVDWIFMGMCPKELRPFVKESHEFVAFNEYPQTLSALDLDLAIAPLEQHPFNEAKSNLRLLEYGIMGWPVIATDIYPYKHDAAPVTLIQNEVQIWIDTILAALSEPEKIAAQGRQLQKWVRQKYMLEDHLDEWLKIFKSL